MKSTKVKSKKGNLLFGRVSQLVLPPAIVALLYTGVGPETLDGFHVGALESRHALEVDRCYQLRLFLEIHHRAAG